MAKVKPTLVGANSAAGTSVTIPTHQVGDLLILFVYRTAGALPTVPSASGTVPAWTPAVDSGNGNTNAAYIVAYRATATNHTSGTWTNATGIAALVVGGANWTTPIGNHATANGTSSNSVPGTPGSLQYNDGSSLVLEFYAHRSVTAWAAAPAGHTRQTEVSTQLCVNTLNVTTSYAATAQSATTSSTLGYFSAALEIVGADPFSPLDVNINRAGEPIPDSVSGCYVTLVGGGGGGGGGFGSTGQQKGSGGGGGGSQVARVFIPKSLLGPTVTVARGLGGGGGAANANGSDGTASVFSSGSITLTAGAGKAGKVAGTGTGGAGGTASASGVSATCNSGTAGATGVAGVTPTDAVLNASGAAAGGGAGGYGAYGGSDGGDSLAASGGAGGTAVPANTPGNPGSSPSNAPAGKGGAGGGGGSGANSAGGVLPGAGAAGGTAGGGGGGGGSRSGGLGGITGGQGGDGDTVVEWVTSPGTFFPFIAA